MEFSLPATVQTKDGKSGGGREKTTSEKQRQKDELRNQQRPHLSVFIQSQRRVARQLEEEEEEEEMISKDRASMRDTKGGCERERVSSVMELRTFKTSAFTIFLVLLPGTLTLLHNYYLYMRRLFRTAHKIKRPFNIRELSRSKP